MTLHDLIAEFEAEVASLFARFRSHPAVVAVPDTAPPVAPVEAPATGTDNWLTRDIASQAGPQVATPSNDPGNPWLEYQSGVLVVPAEWGYAGNSVKALNDCEIHFQCSDTVPRDVIVNQGSIPQAPTVTVETLAGVVTKELSAPSAQHCGVVSPVNGEIVVKLSQSGGCVVQLGFVA